MGSLGLKCQFLYLSLKIELRLPPPPPSALRNLWMTPYIKNHPSCVFLGSTTCYDKPTLIELCLNNKSFENLAF